MENCRLCGALIEGQKCKNVHDLKKMCINCQFCKKTEDGDFICTNEENMTETREKMYNALMQVSSAYQVDLKLSPLPLKKPLCKCNRWNLHEDVLKEVIDLFK